MRTFWATAAIYCSLITIAPAVAEPLKVGTFSLDATPPLGTPLCDGLCPVSASVDDPLSARGIVLVGAGKPIVLIAFDWVGIGNSGYDAYRTAVARAVGTEPDRVAIHSLHQHDAPGCDFEAEALLTQHGLAGAMFNVVFARELMNDLAKAAAKAAADAKPATHVGLGKAKIDQVASARRVIGPDGKVKYTRTSATKNAEARAEPEGVVDPYVQLISFWDGEKPVAVLSYYATHPMSYYGSGKVSADFIGLARNARQQATGVPHIHFDGAGGNVTAGKYNDGNPDNRAILTDRVAAGMTAAWEATQRTPITAADVAWKVEGVTLPVSPLYVDPSANEQKIDDESLKVGQRVQQARHVIFARRMQSGHQIPLQLLRVGPAYVLHMPGELFIEYQLAAQQMRPDAPVLMAAYGDYGPGYIGMKWSYPQGGYETGVVSRVAPEVEDVLMPAMRRLMGVDEK